MSKKPKVSFVVPCYKLAHLLPECVNSILAQTYEDFEVLIMDDCSPDNTPEVARSFQDPRVQHIRNQPNLGHLRNYNKGIGLARGEYVWLISADDRLRSSQVLEKYVRLLEANPRIGYVFCPAVGLQDHTETGIVDYSLIGSEDKVFDGRKLLEKLVMENFVIAASGLSRRECYEKVSMFPLDMPWAGDWYLWCVFALHYDVGYFAEPMVNYRQHELSMTNHLLDNSLDVMTSNDIEIPWEIKRQAEALGFDSVVRSCRWSIVHEYARSIAKRKYRTSLSKMPLKEFENSLNSHCNDVQEGSWFRYRAYEAVADYFYLRGEYGDALSFYKRACAQGQSAWDVRLKYWLLRIGKLGIALRSSIMNARRTLTA